jgi:protein TonB
VTRNTIPTIENNQVDKSKAISSPMESWVPVTMRPLASAAREKALFEDSLLDSTVGQRKRRTWSTVFSFVLQCLVIGFLLLLPLWFTEVLPKEQLVTLLVAPPPPPPAASTASRPKVVKVASNIAYGRLRAPSRIPTKVQMIKDDDAPPPTITGGVVGGVPGGIPGGQLDGVIGGIIGSTSSLAAAPALFKPKPAPAQRVRVSPGVIKGLLIHRVEPIYPFLAQQARIQGAVVLTAIIDKDGNVQHPATCERAAAAGPGSHRGGQAMALQAISSEWATSGSRNHSHG